jgi:chemotaxis family two-component system sensor kinase Cph1
VTPRTDMPVSADPTAGCDREPIHVPGSIQPHGHLLAFAGDDFALVHASAAASAVLATGVADAFGHPLERVFAGTPVEPMRDNLESVPAQDKD